MEKSTLITLSLSFLLVIFIVSNSSSQVVEFSDGNSELFADIDGDGKKENIFLESEPQYGVYDGKRGLDANIFTINAVFENGNTVVVDNAARVDGNNPAYLVEIKISESIPSMIGVENFLGAHSGILRVYKYEDGEIIKDLEIFSNSPRIEIKDTDNDGMKEIVSYSRNYGKNPTRDQLIEIYKYENEKWKMIESKEI
ncbi:hypothetical protein KJ641_00020 [Patescibacteria group bacterium]|nr:hypothetical protein [Patescibacteria group bacterium]